MVWNKISYVKYRKKDLVRDMENLNLSDDDNEGLEELEPLSKEEEKDALLFFRTCIVDRDLIDLKNKMRRTIKLREVLMKKKGTIFHQMFPFYFIEPTLVCF